MIKFNYMTPAGPNTYVSSFSSPMSMQSDEKETKETGEASQKINSQNDLNDATTKKIVDLNYIHKRITFHVSAINAKYKALGPKFEQDDEQQNQQEKINEVANENISYLCCLSPKKKKEVKAAVPSREMDQKTRLFLKELEEKKTQELLALLDVLADELKGGVSLNLSTLCREMTRTVQVPEIRELLLKMVQKILVNSPMLEILDISMCQVDPQIKLQLLKTIQLNHLKSIQLGDEKNEFISTEDFTSIGRNLPQLQVLRMGYQNIHSLIQAADYFPNLIGLHTCRTDLDDTIFRQISKNFPTLKCIFIRHQGTRLRSDCPFFSKVTVLNDQQEDSPRMHPTQLIEAYPYS